MKKIMDKKTYKVPTIKVKEADLPTLLAASAEQLSSEEVYPKDSQAKHSIWHWMEE